MLNVGIFAIPLSLLSSVGQILAPNKLGVNLIKLLEVRILILLKLDLFTKHKNTVCTYKMV